jgi:hypothetical protein
MLILYANYMKFLTNCKIIPWNCVSKQNNTLNQNIINLGRRNLFYPKLTPMLASFLHSRWKWISYCKFPFESELIRRCGVGLKVERVEWESRLRPIILYVLTWRWSTSCSWLVNCWALPRHAGDINYL